MNWLNWRILPHVVRKLRFTPTADLARCGRDIFGMAERQLWAGRFSSS
jgi:hypothetical protein